MDFISTVILTTVILAVLIAFHEFSHFTFAKLFNVFVERFSIGFGKILFSKQIGETEYAISLIPFGGYVKMLGEEDNLLQGKDGELPIEISRSFARIFFWKQALIVLAGPGGNFFMAFVIYVFLGLYLGVPMMNSKVSEVMESLPAKVAGIKVGDSIYAISLGTGEKYTEVSALADIKGFLAVSKNTSVTFYFYRNPENCDVLICPNPLKLETTLVPRLMSGVDEFGLPVEQYSIGISGTEERLRGVQSAVWGGWRATRDTSMLIVRALGKLVTGSLSPQKSLGGPIAIGKMVKNVKEQGGYIGLLDFTAGFSVNLAILNLLPLPVVDGGQLVWILIPGAVLKRFGRKLSPVYIRWVQSIGLILIVAIMIFALTNDFSGLLPK